jgi:hypothetical protein
MSLYTGPILLGELVLSMYRPLAVETNLKAISIVIKQQITIWILIQFKDFLAPTIGVNIKALFRSDVPANYPSRHR